MSWIRQSREKSRLGELLLNRGLITPAQLDLAIQRQGETGEMLGQALTSLGFLTQAQISRALRRQRRIRVFATTLALIFGPAHALAAPPGQGAQFFEGAQKTWSGKRTGWVNTDTTVHASAPGSLDIGLSPAYQVQVRILLSPRDPDKLEALLNASTGGKGPILSAAEINDRFAPTTTQVAQVENYLRSNGFANIEVSGDHLVVTAHGNSSAIKTAFNTVLIQETLPDGKIRFYNNRPVQVPAALADIVKAVQGLQGTE